MDIGATPEKLPEASVTGIQNDAPVVTDWEDVFENPEHGLIPLVTQARTTESLKKCLLVIVESLFSRDSDTKFRESYARKLDGILPENVQLIDGTGGELEIIKKGVVEMLRQIKDFRIEKAEEALAKTAEERMSEAADRKTKDSEDANLLLDVNADIEKAGAAKKPANDPEPVNAESQFSKMFCAEYEARLGILRAGVSQKTSADFKLPFLLSEDFNVRFEEVLREFFIENLLHRCRGLMNKAESLKPSEQIELFQKYFSGRIGKTELWGFWQATWTDITEAKEEPKKPEPKKKKGLLGFAKKEKARPDYLEPELTEEEWKDAVKQVKRANAKTMRMWDTLCADAETYDPPMRDRDGQLLKELFGRSTNGTVNQIRAINQIVDQGVDMGRVFGEFQQGKNVEICLLAACYQRPQQYLGEKGRLNELLQGFRRRDFPLISRYLPDYIRE